MRSRYCRTLAIGFAFLIGTGGRAALAQESPELPSKARTEGEPTTEDQIRFYKGKGPGRGNSYVERYEEDYSYLRDPARSSDFFDPLKFIPLGAEGEVYLTLNGEARFRYDDTDHRNFAIAAAATPARTAGARPTLTPATEVSTNQLYNQRYALGADLHLGPNVRFYADLYHGQQTGHRVGPTIPGNQRDALGLVNGFGEVYGILGDAKTGFRAGRQEIFFGNNLQVRANVSTNLPSPVFDEFRAYRDWGPARVDAFAYNLVQFVDGILQDRDNPHVNLWGVYGSYDGLRVDAFAFNTDTGYTFHGVPWKPRLGVHIDRASGGADRTGGTLHTYQPMYPNTQYYVPNNEFAPTNFYDIAPRISLAP